MPQLEDRELDAAGGQSGDETAAHDQSKAFEDDFGSRGTINDADRNTQSRQNNKDLGGRLKGLVGGRGKLILGAVGGTGIIGLLVGMVLLLIPLKIEHMVKNLETKALSRTEQAVQNRAEKLFTRYMVLRLAGGPAITTGAFASDLYKNWRVNKFESKLAKNHGIKFEKLGGTGQDSRYRVITKAGNSKAFKAADFDLDKLEPEDSRRSGNRNFLKNEIKFAVREQTKSYQILRRRHVRYLLMKKYGVSRWRFYNDIKDNYEDKKGKGKAAVRKVVREKILSPYFRLQPLLITCLVGDCPKDQLPNNTDAPPYDEDIDNARPPTGDFKDPIEDKDNDGDENRSPAEQEAELDREVADGTAKDTSKTVTKKILGKAIPIIGTAELLYQLHQFIEKDVYRDVLTARNSVQYANAWAAFRNFGDELKAGHMDIESIGAMSNKLDGMESSRVYEEQFQLTKTGKKVTCPSGNQLPKDQLVCDERQVTPPSSFTDSVRNSPFFKATKPIVVIYSPFHDVVIAVLDTVGEVIFGTIRAALSVFGIDDDLENAIGGAIKGLVSLLIGPVMTGHETGPKLFDGVAAGADVTGNDVAHLEAGGKKLDSAEIALLDQEIRNEDQRVLGSRRGFARLFNLESTYSFGSRMLASMPMGPVSITNSFVQMAARPLNQIGQLSLSIFTLDVSAQNNKTNPFNVDVYGYPPGFDFDYDPNKYTDEYCKKFEENWDHTTGEVENICRLEKVTTNNLQSMFTDKDDGGLAKGGCVAGSGSTGATGGKPSRVFIIGDSIMEAAYFSTPELKATLDSSGIAHDADAQGSRAIKDHPGQTRTRTTGLEAVSINAETIKKSDAVLVELGANTEGDNFKSNAREMIRKIKSVNPSATIYWAEIISTGDSHYTGYNEDLEDLASTEGINIIKTRGFGIKLDDINIHPAYTEWGKYAEAIVGGLAGDASANSCSTQTATDKIDVANLYKDSSGVACAPGTKDLDVQDGYYNGQKVPVRVCAVQSVPETGDLSPLPGANGKLVVNSRLSAFYVKLIDDAKSDGVSPISAQEGFRTMARQIELQPTGNAAPPGFSNHQMGIAVDWNTSITAWLNSNGDKYGLKALVRDEPWHWSPSGN